MAADAIKTLATLIANDLFTCGSGEHAERLVLYLDSEKRDLGGLCESACARHIEKMLRTANVTVPAK